MNIHESGEDYLETILMLQKRMDKVHSIDIATHMGFSKPSISIAMRRLGENGYITVSKKKEIYLTELGTEVAERMYERHILISQLLMDLGVPAEVAVREACKIEHDISADTFERIKDFYRLFCNWRAMNEKSGQPRDSYVPEASDSKSEDNLLDLSLQPPEIPPESEDGE